MKEFQKGILDNDKFITAENVQRMGEVIALCAIKTVIVRGGIVAGRRAFLFALPKPVRLKLY